jgi:hypothetical protein
MNRQNVTTQNKAGMANNLLCLLLLMMGIWKVIEPLKERKYFE